MKISMPERNRSYKVMLHALIQEIRACQPSKEEIKEKMHSIFDSCYGDLPSDRRPTF